MNQKKIFTLTVAAVLALPLTGCVPAANPNNMGNNQGVRIMNNRTDYVSRPDIAERVMRTVPGVSSAVVLVKNNTAYVAVGQGRVRRENRTNRAGGTDYNMRGAVSDGTYGYSKAGGNVTGPGTGLGAPSTGGGSAGGRTGGGTTGSGPTGAGTTGGGTNTQAVTDLPPDMKQRVETAVRQADPSISAVYSSNDPTLMTRFNKFNANRVGARTRAGINELGDVIRRVFPTGR
ncbi:hypothetical protein [Effusibacillus consociatus]|uniref:Sporulation protein n=1 Tax=Effusibacillus consociatus TaxID=1117041 RepID=A0ABV9Q2S8_9BACL